jgi:hypothetical protein
MKHPPTKEVSVMKSKKECSPLADRLEQIQAYAEFHAVSDEQPSQSHFHLVLYQWDNFLRLTHITVLAL